jgi:hypothetical protein
MNCAEITDAFRGLWVNGRARVFVLGFCEYCFLESWGCCKTVVKVSFEAQTKLSASGK